MLDLLGLGVGLLLSPLFFCLLRRSTGKILGKLMKFISVETKNSGYLLNLRFSSRVRFQARDSLGMFDPLQSLPVSDRSQQLEKPSEEKPTSPPKRMRYVYPLVN